MKNVLRLSVQVRDVHIIHIDGRSYACDPHIGSHRSISHPPDHTGASRWPRPGEVAMGLIDGDKPYQEMARRALPILVRQARAHRTMFYGELESLAWSGLHRGIVLFNQANTDAPDMSPDTELVLTCSAIEQILGITSRPDQRQFPARFAEAWHPDREVPRSEWRGSPTDKPWTKDTLRACWASDLKICRGNLAHGHREDGLQSWWTVRQHLLLTSFTVPLLVKQILSAMDVYALPDVFAPPCPGDDEGGLPARRLRVAVCAAAGAGPPVALPRRFQTVNANGLCPSLLRHRRGDGRGRCSKCGTSARRASPYHRRPSWLRSPQEYEYPGPVAS